MRAVPPPNRSLYRSSTREVPLAAVPEPLSSALRAHAARNQLFELATPQEPGTYQADASAERDGPREIDERTQATLDPTSARVALLRDRAAPRFGIVANRDHHRASSTGRDDGAVVEHRAAIRDVGREGSHRRFSHWQRFAGHAR